MPAAITRDRESLTGHRRVARLPAINAGEGRMEPEMPTFRRAETGQAWQRFWRSRVSDYVGLDDWTEIDLMFRFLDEMYGLLAQRPRTPEAQSQRRVKLSLASREFNHRSDRFGLTPLSKIRLGIGLQVGPRAPGTKAAEPVEEPGEAPAEEDEMDDFELVVPE